MNWEAIGAIGEIVGALAVVLTLVYLAYQVRYAKTATVDQNRLTRSTAIREIINTMITNEELRVGQMKNWGLEGYYDTVASELGVSAAEASRNEWANAYYFWTYWGQWRSTHGEHDRAELEHIIPLLFSMPGVRHTWDKSPLGKALMDEGFVEFVDGIIARELEG